MVAEDSSTVPVAEQPADQLTDPAPVIETPDPVTEQSADQPTDPVPVIETPPAAATESQVVILSDDQFIQLRDLGVYQVAGIWTLIGILVIVAFWIGWRSTK